MTVRDSKSDTEFATENDEVKVRCRPSHAKPWSGATLSLPNKCHVKPNSHALAPLPKFQPAKTGDKIDFMELNNFRPYR